MNYNVLECIEVPDSCESNQVVRLVAKNSNSAFYNDRTNRNIGWITQDEQNLLKSKVIGIAGCGGMGGMLAQIFSRLGVGEIRIADPEVFEISNLNRQFAATKNSLGKSKALETARATRAILDDGTLVVYSQGICEEAADDFLAGCDCVCDEIEFWAIGARILLHQRARGANVPLFTCNTIGFGTRLFFFEPKGFTMEGLLGWTYEQASELERRIQQGEATSEERALVIERKLRLIPELPEYMIGEPESDRKAVLKRLLTEGKASIVATNPPMAAGFLADRILLYLLRNSGVERRIATAPSMPGYLYFDAALMQARTVAERWW